MNNDRLKFLIREAIDEKSNQDLINAAISYLIKGKDFNVDSGILLLAKAILCDKRNDKKHEYDKINPEAFKISKLAIEKVDKIRRMDAKLFREMVKDGSKRKYRKMVDMNNKIIVIGE